MPEGDTVHTLAALIGGYLRDRELLAGRVLPGRRAAKPGAVVQVPPGRVDAVHASGKHLYIELDGGRSLRVHLGLHGSWHRYAPGEPWKRPARQARVVLETGTAVLVCFNAAEAELLEARGDAVPRAVARSRVGPDLALGRAAPESATRARALCPAHAPVVDALLDQRIAAGIGNVYKSEVLFVCAVHPRTPLGALDDAQLATLYACAARLIAANVDRARRRTRAAAGVGGALWVYGRAGAPCLRCAATVQHATFGRHWRSTYWCEHCQAPVG